MGPLRAAKGGQVGARVLDAGGGGGANVVGNAFHSIFPPGSGLGLVWG